METHSYAVKQIIGQYTLVIHGVISNVFSMVAMKKY